MKRWVNTLRFCNSRGRGCGALRNLLQEVLSDNGRLIDDAFFVDADHEPDELGHAPGQRSRAPRTRAENKMRFCGVGLVPDLFRNHAAGVGEVQHRIEVTGGIAATGDFIFSTLTYTLLMNCMHEMIDGLLSGKIIGVPDGI
jgi:hypothetical protein